MKETPNYYAIITADVRYSERISAQEKLLYAEITALSNAYGFCYATDEYFAKNFKVDERTIRRWILNLVENSFIQKETISSPAGGKERFLTIVKKQDSEVPDKNVRYVQDKNVRSSINNINIEYTNDKNEFLGFPLPEEWSDESYVDSDGNYIPRFKDEYGRPIKQSEIKIMAKKYQTAQKAQKTKAVNSEFATKAVKILQQKQGIYKLDGGDNVKYANEFREMFKDHLKKDFGIDADDEKALQNYEKFLDLVIIHPFHGKNATSMGYLVRNFNKIIRDVRK